MSFTVPLMLTKDHSVTGTDTLILNSWVKHNASKYSRYRYMWED